MVTLPLSCNCCRVRMVTGAGVVRSLRRTRVPVTRISSSAADLAAGVSAAEGSAVAGCGSAAVVGAGLPAGLDSCAAAIPAARTPKTNVAANVLRVGVM